MIRVSASAFDILWEDLGYTRPPAPLEVRSVGSTGRERADIREAVYENLAERRLCVGGSLDAALVDRLHTLANATVFVECEALMDMNAETPFRAVAAAHGKRAVLAAQPSKTIGLSRIRDTELFSAIVDLLPTLEPGPGFGVSLPASALGGDMADPVFSDGGGSAPYASQIREVLAIQARPVFRAGQFSVRVREPEGRLRRAGGVSWFATDLGDYLGTVEPGRGEQDWATVVPADGPRLATRLADLVGSRTPSVRSMH